MRQHLRDRLSKIELLIDDVLHFQRALFRQMTRAPRRTAKKKQAVAPILAARIGAAPLLSSSKETRQKVSSWLADIAGTVNGNSLKQLLGGSTHVRALIDGVADGSPYLWQLASAEPARLLALLQSDPDAHLARRLSATDF